MKRNQNLVPYQQRGPPGSQLQTFFIPCAGTRDSRRAGTRVTVLSPARVTRVVTGTAEPETELGSCLEGLMSGSASQIIPRGSQLHRLVTFLSVLFVCDGCCCCCRCCCGVMMLLDCAVDRVQLGWRSDTAVTQGLTDLVSVYLWLDCGGLGSGQGLTHCSLQISHHWFSVSRGQGNGSYCQCHF